MATLKAFSRLLVAGIGLASIVFGSDIEGYVVIKRKLTRPRVTATVPLYQRGIAVGLRAANNDDPLALERSRVAVYIEGSGPAVPAVAKIEQINREFSPELVVIPAGSQVTFPNMDPIFHNVFSLSKVKSFDLGNYPRGDTRTVTFPQPGIVYVNCHLHPNMTAAIVVAPNGWNARVERSGHFTINDVAPGKYTIVAWHRVAGFFRQSVEITEDHSPSIEFYLPIGADGVNLEASK